MTSVIDDNIEIPEIELGEYRHYKGKKYEVIGVGLDTETQEPFVIYKPLYESKVPYWIRPLAMFNEVVELDGIKTSRFTKL